MTRDEARHCRAGAPVGEQNELGGSPSSVDKAPSGTVDSVSSRDVEECVRLLDEIWPQADVQAEQAPRRLGRFMIVRELGHGGFGVVFLAEDPLLGRQVALKVPRIEVLSESQAWRRFLREARTASRLDHPNLVPLLEAGTIGPVGYIASAFVEGPTLEQCLKRARSAAPARFSARLIATLAGALRHMHGRGILHRDLKPANILMQSPDCHGERPASLPWDGPDVDSWVPRICDFGLAKLREGDGDETRSRSAAGSPPYMSPEQAEARHDEIGPATDIYGLGATLYQLLTGRPPFSGASELETLRRVVADEPARPRQLRRDLPRDLETICLKCLAKRAEQRYGSAAALAADLERFLEGRPILARPAPAWERGWKWARRRPVHTILAIVSVLSLSSFLGLLILSHHWLRWHDQNLHVAVSRAQSDIRAERSAQDARIEVARSEDRDQFGSRYGLATQIRLIHEAFELGNVALAARMLDTLRSATGRPAPRGFAWGYLNDLFRPEVTKLGDYRPEYSPFLRLVISPDSRTVAAGTSDGQVVVWDLVEKRLLRSLRHQEPARLSEVYFLAWSRDSRLLASGSTGHIVKIWDVSTGAARAEIHASANVDALGLECLFDLRFSDSSDFLLTFWRNPKHGSFLVLAWSVPAPGARAELKGTLDPEQLPKFVGDRPLIYKPSWPRGDEARAPWLAYAREHLILLDDGATVAIKEGRRATVYEPKFYTPVAKISEPFNIPVVVEGSALTRQIAYFAACARRVAGPSTNHEHEYLGPYRVPDLSPDGQTLAGADPVGVSLIDSVTERTESAYTPKGMWKVNDLAFTPDGRALVFAGYYPQIHVWRLRCDRLAGHAKETWSLAFSPDAKSLASASDDHAVKIWDLATGRERATLKGHGSLVTAVAYSADGALLASASFDKTIRLWSATSGEHLATLPGHTGRVRAIAFSPDGETLASAGDDLAIRLWDVAAQSELASPLAGHSDSVFSLAFSPDGKTLFSGATDKTIRVWDWAAGRSRAVWREENQVYCLAVSPDGQTLAVGQKGGRLTLWDTTQEKPRPPLRGHVDDVLGVAFSPDGLAVASVSRDKTVWLWDPLTAQELLTLKGHEGPVHAVAFSPDSAVLATGSHDGAIKLWRAAPEASK